MEHEQEVVRSEVTACEEVKQEEVVIDISAGEVEKSVDSVTEDVMLESPTDEIMSHDADATFEEDLQTDIDFAEDIAAMPQGTHDCLFTSLACVSLQEQCLELYLRLLIHALLFFCCVRFLSYIFTYICAY